MGFVTKHTKCCSLASLDPGDGQSCKKPNNVELGENFEIINSPTFDGAGSPKLMTASEQIFPEFGF